MKYYGPWNDYQGALRAYLAEANEAVGKHGRCPSEE
jgi:hypothetical protein